jgi:hypothetical protein
MTMERLARAMEAIIADGATVNGLTTANQGARSPLNSAREGDNLVGHLDKFRGEHGCLVPVIGVWCTPHCADLVADALTDGEDLPTFASLKNFLTASVGP